MKNSTMKSLEKLPMDAILGSSSHWHSASSWRIQFHRVHVRNSVAVVTPFVQVATYTTRIFSSTGPVRVTAAAGLQTTSEE
jgi:hypothetical protein